MAIHDGEFSLLAGTQDDVGFVEGDALRCGDEGGGHDLVKGRRGGLELDVACGDDTNELSPKQTGI